MNFKIRIFDCHKNKSNLKTKLTEKANFPQKSKMEFFFFLLFKMTGDAEYNNKATANPFL